MQIDRPCVGSSLPAQKRPLESALSQIDRIIADAHRAGAQRRDREGRIECKPSLDRLRFINSTQMRKGRGRPKFYRC
jgi:hypothetical protein